MRDGLAGGWTAGAARHQRLGSGPRQARTEQNVVPVKVFNASTYLRENSLCSWVDPDAPRTLGTWPQFFRADPRIALGKYSPLEKEILRLGGAQSLAARRFLTQKHREEQKEIRKLPLSSWAPAQELRCPGMSSVPCVRLPRAWTARVHVPCGQLQMPPRERATASRHVERTRRARGLPSRTLSWGDSSEGLGGLGMWPEDSLSIVARGQSWEEGGTELLPGGGGPRKSTQLDAAACKTEEPPMGLGTRHRAEGPCPPRSTGLAHRNRLAAADFPGDLLLMARSFTAWGMRVGQPARVGGLQEERCLHVAPQQLGFH